MDSRFLDAVSVLTALIVLPLVGVSAYAYISGELVFSEYSAMWAEPVALLLGFWLRGVDK